MATKAVIYARFSPRPNADESESCEKQEAICREYCARKGYEVAGYFEDKEYSGDDEDRPGLWSAVEALKRNYVLVVRWRNRLARDVYLSEYINREVKKRNARIEAAEDGSNGDNPEDTFIRQIMAAVSEHEKKIIAARTKRAMLRYQKQGIRMGKWPPYGWVTDPANDKRIVLCPEQQEVIEIMKRLRAEGMTLAKIGQHLDMLGYKPQRADDWEPKVILKILNRE